MFCGGKMRSSPSAFVNDNLKESKEKTKRFRGDMGHKSLHVTTKALV
jgi:hypothetical protein